MNNDKEEENSPKKYKLKLSGTVKKRKTEDTSQNNSEENIKETKISKNFFRKKTTSIDSFPPLSSEEESENPKKKKQNKNKKHEHSDVIVNNYVLFKEIANGTFGKIFYGFSLKDNIEIAVKKEIISIEYSQIKIENKIYHSLLNIPKNADLSGRYNIPQNNAIGVPKYYGTGSIKNTNYLILEFLGPNLIQLLKFCGNKKFTVITVFLMAIQILNRIEYLHKFHYVHRDIKPENFVIGTGNKSNIIYLIDFGLSKLYKNPKNHQHVPYRDGKKLTGTIRYISINTHLGVEQSRRDDLESIAYVLILLLKGCLPWQNLPNDKSFQLIMKKKLQIPTEILCYKLPDEIALYLNYCKSLRFEDRPDYDYLKSIFVRGITIFASKLCLSKESLFFDWLIEDKHYIRKILKIEKSIICNGDDFDKKDNNKSNEKISNNTPKLNKILFNKENNEFTDSLSSSSSSDEIEDLNNNEPSNKYNYSSLSKTSKSSPIVSKSNNLNNDKNNDISELEKLNDEESSSSGTIHVKFKGILQGKTDNEKQNEKFDTLVSSMKTKEKIDQYIDTLISNSKGVNVEIESDKNSDSDDEYSYSSVNLKGMQTPTYNLKGSFEDNNENNSNRKLNFQLAESGITFKMKTNRTNSNVVNENFRKESKFIETNRINSKEEKYKKNENEQEKDFSFFNSNNSNINESNLSNLNLTYKKNRNYSGTLVSDQTNSNKKNLKFKISNKEKYTYNKFKTEKFDNPNVYKNLTSFPHNPNEIMSFEDLLKKGKSTEKLNTLKMLSDTGGNLSNIQIPLAKENIIRINNEPVSNYYIILDNLGQGSYGRVKRVKHRKLNEIRAMKIVDKKSLSSQHEIEILRKISHPNIINIYEIFQDHKQYYIICEYCEGGELFSIISRRGNFTEKEAAKITKQILQGINYLHSNNIIHRDLKPENIIFVSNDNEIIKIIDFGSAVEVKNKSKKLKKLIGTPYYIAPEVLRENYNEKCDIWSCGVILFILLCGYPPFNGRSNKEIYNKIENSSPLYYDEEWNEISKEAKDLCKKMLKKNPNERLSAEECLKHKWFNIINSIDEENKAKNNQNKIIKKMALFVKQNKFKQAVLQFISTQFDLKKEEEDLRNIFKEFDHSNKGVISKEDFKEQLEKIYGEIITNELADEVFEQLDLDNSGSISYNEFITSVIGNRKNMTEERLENAFKMLDKDNNGLLSIDEIKSYFGGENEIWKEVLKDVDENGDGQIDFKEFHKIMAGLKPGDLLEETIID